MLEQCAKIASVYEKTPDLIFDYLEDENITHIDIIENINILNSKLLEIEYLEKENCYDKQIQSTFKIIPKLYEVIITEDLVNYAIGIDDENIKEVSEEFKDSYKELSITAFKFQVRYFILIFENILRDNDWSSEFV